MGSRCVVSFGAYTAVEKLLTIAHRDFVLVFGVIGFDEFERFVYLLGWLRG